MNRKGLLVKSKRILVTGAAGFIGMHVCKRFLENGHRVHGVDNLNSYYSTKLKRDRLQEIATFTNFEFSKEDICNLLEMESIYKSFAPDFVVHLAAQAGVRYSIDNPHAYYHSNIIGTGNILELARRFKTEQLVLASSSSVYGQNQEQPFSEGHRTDNPISLYAATKKSNELAAYSYSHLFNIPITCLRFFTVYGPWGRPDMAPWIFTESILEGREIKVFNYGRSSRDFTFIDDITLKIQCLAQNNSKAQSKPNTQPPFRIFNIGSGKPQNILEFIKTIERACQKKAQLDLVESQPGDVPITFADTRKIINATNSNEFTTIDIGIGRFVKWFKSYRCR